MKTPTYIQAIPTNVITGFLGSGKTTTILSLLKNKPSHERWAILVNEFGDIGVDGALFESQSPNDVGVFIREVPGGCMCCAAGVPMQIALNELLKQARPDRLLIEPTGLGHPKEVLQVLTGEHYRHVLAVQKTLTLVDARKLTDERYTRHDTFNQQIAIADVIVGNKSDLYQPEDIERLHSYVKHQAPPSTDVCLTEFGKVEVASLSGGSHFLAEEASHHAHDHAHPHAHSHGQAMDPNRPFPSSGIIEAVNRGDGYVSYGWRFDARHVFAYDAFLAFRQSINIARLKAVVVTDRGVFSYNQTSDGCTEKALPGAVESRIELITDDEQVNIGLDLLSCRVNN